MTGRRFRYLAVIPMSILQGALLGGCATYHARPLSEIDHDPSLVGPAPEILSATVAAVHHPRLADVPIDLTRPLGPDQVALLAVALQPAVRAIRSQRALANAQVIQAGLLPNPQLSVSTDLPMNAEEAVPALGAGLSWEVTSLITASAKRDSATANAEAIDLGVAWQEWQVAVGAKLAALRVVSLTNEVALTTEIADFQRQRAERFRHATSNGFSTQFDVDASSDAAADAEMVLAVLRQEAENQRLALNRALGLPPAVRIHLDAAAFTMKQVAPPVEHLQAEMEHSRLDLVGLRRGYDSQEAAVRAAVLGQFPKISLGLQRNRDTSALNTFGFGLAIDLPLFDRNQGVIATEEATRDRLYREYIDRIFQARADIAQAAADLVALDEQITGSHHTLARLEARLATQEDARIAGLIDDETVAATHLAVMQKRHDALRLEQQSREALVACELASGLYIPKSLPENLP